MVSRVSKDSSQVVASYKPYLEYRDEGCDLWGKCLTCPYEVCLKEEMGKKVLEVRERLRKVEKAREMADMGIKVVEIACQLMVTERTVWRWLSIKVVNK